MAKQKKETPKENTKEDFTSFILGIEPPVPPSNNNDTRVLTEPSLKEQEGDTQKITPVKTKEEDIEKNHVVSQKKETKKSESFSFDPSMVSVEAALRQAELLQLAQKRNQELEKQLDEVLKENETLSASVSVINKKLEQAQEKVDELKKDLASKDDKYLSQIELRDKQIQEIKKEKFNFEKKYLEMEALISDKFLNSRRREKELMNRIEILSKEGDFSISSKEDMILKLKKELDEKNFEIEKIKDELLLTKDKLEQFKEKNSRSLKALKLASTLLDDDSESESLEIGPKKVG